MILIFSGTGNSAYVARQLGELLQEETIDVFARMCGMQFCSCFSVKL